MKWNIEYVKEAQRDLKRLDPYNRKIILKATEKTAERPLPPDGIGKPPGNHSGSRPGVVSVRDDEAVYKEADRRIQDMIKRSIE